MKNSVLLKTLGLTLIAGIAVSGFSIPAKTVSADEDKLLIDSDHVVNLQDELPHREGALLISTKGVDLTEDSSSLGFKVKSVEKIEVSFDDNLYLVEYDDVAIKSCDVAANFDSSTFNYVEYDYICKFQPIESYAGSGLEKPGWHNDYMDAQGAWKILAKTSHSKVRVGIVDMGVDYTHPEMEGLVNKNLSYDVYHKKKLDSDGFGDHGTHVAGIIGGRYGGGDDVTRGVASGDKNDVVEIVSVNIMNANGQAYESDCATGISYAADKNCKVVNMSFGGVGYSNTMSAACRYAYHVKGVCLIAAAGNNGDYPYYAGDVSCYPCDYPEVFSVMAADAYADPTIFKGASYSNYGALKDVIAPGTSVTSSVVGGSYKAMSGTSMASPCVTGVATLMVSVNPKLTAAQIKSLIKSTCLDLYTPGFDEYTGYGMVDAAEAVAAAKAYKTSGVVESFVRRVYESALNRIPDDATVAAWTESLNNGTTGAEFIEAICNAPELEELDYNDTTFVTMLYSAIFDRNADADGLTNWLDYLDSGCSRKSLVAQFINSDEFAALCESYGIEAGRADFDKESERNLKVTEFVERLYAICLERGSEEAGLEFWCKKINSGDISAQEIVSFFFLGAEYEGLNTDNEKFLEDLYLAFFGREADADGFAFWANLLDNGTDREDILAGFIYSEEFSALCASYGVRQF